MKLVGLAVLLARSIPRKGKPNMTLSKGTVATWVLRGAESCGGFGPLAALRYDRDKILMPAEADICVALYKKLRAEADEVHRKSMRDRFKRSIEAAA